MSAPEHVNPRTADQRLRGLGEKGSGAGDNPSRRLLGLFSGDAEPATIAAAIMTALDHARGVPALTTDDTDDTTDDDSPPTRLDPGVGNPPQDPYSIEQLIQAQNDRLLQMAVFGLTEEDFGDEAIWIVDDEGNHVTEIDEQGNYITATDLERP